MKRTPIVLGATVLAGLAMIPFSCAKKESDDSGSESSGTDGADSGGQAGTVAVSTSPLAEAIYPAGLNVTAFPTEKPDAAKVGTIGVSTEPAAPAAQLLLQSNPPPPGQPGGQQSCQQKYQVDTTGREFSVANADANSTGNVDPTQPCAQPQANPPVNQPNNMALTEETKQLSGQAKIDQEQEVLSGQAAECLSDHALRLISSPPPEGSEGCYQFDYGIMQGASCVKAQEVCMVTTARNLVDAGATHIEGGLGIMQAMLCQAKKDGKGDTLPAVGESIDLAQNLQTAVAGRNNAPQISVAKIQRLPDVDGKAVYKSTLEFTAQNGQSVQFNLAHAPTESAAEYSGVMWIRKSGGNANGQQGANGVTALSVQYARTGEGAAARLKMDVLSASLAAELEPFTAEGRVNLPSDQTLQNSSLSSITRYMFDLNPETSEGQLALWKNPGGGYSESARGFVFDVSYDQEANALKGCGVAGADEKSIRASVAEGGSLSPSRVYTPSICRADGSAGPGDNVAPKVWKQCFAQSEDGKSYVVDKTKTTHESGFDYIAASEGGLSVPAVTFSSLGSVNL